MKDLELLATGLSIAALTCYLIAGLLSADLLPAGLLSVKLCRAKFGRTKSGRAESRPSGVRTAEAQSAGVLAAESRPAGVLTAESQSVGGVTAEHQSSDIPAAERRFQRAVVFALAGWLFNLGIFIKNIVLNGYAPFASMYQVLSVLSLCFLPIGWLLIGKRKSDRWLWPFFCFPASLPLIGTLFMEKELKWALVPALQSPWFVPHVLSYMLSYSLAAVAFILTLAVFRSGENRRRYDEAVYRILRIAFPFMTAGLCLGALWADQVWGSFWQWDVKEIWSLITALCYLCYFHWRRLPYGLLSQGERAAQTTVGAARGREGVQRPWERSAWIARLWAILGFISLIITFLCVNLLPGVEESFHLYA